MNILPLVILWGGGGGGAAAPPTGGEEGALGGRGGAPLGHPRETSALEIRTVNILLCYFIIIIKMYIIINLYFVHFCQFFIYNNSQHKNLQI